MTMSFHSLWREEEEHVTAVNSKQAECPTHTKNSTRVPSSSQLIKHIIMHS